MVIDRGADADLHVGQTLHAVPPRRCLSSVGVSGGAVVIVELREHSATICVDQGRDGD